MANASERRLWLAILPLATGIGLAAHIVARLSLIAGAALAAGMGAVAAYAVWSRTPELKRRTVRRRALVGVVAGALATVAYDASRLMTIRLFPLHVQPFVALPIFGRLLVGPNAPAGLATAAGVAYHAANGVGFGTAYVFLFRRLGVLTGLLWAGVLELLMLSLYPSWLNLQALDEFAGVSIVGHVAYGLVLGWVARYGVQRGRLEGQPS